ncbi:MAG: hypothetical protein AAGA97_03520 [Pseudomonadota bacterium]
MKHFEKEEKMTNSITRRNLFTMGVAFGTAVALGTQAVAQGGPDLEQRLSVTQRRKAKEKLREQRRRNRIERDKLRRKTKP